MGRKVLIFGASDQGRVVLDIFRRRGDVEPVGFVDLCPEGRFVGRVVDGLPVLGTAEEKQRWSDVADGAIVAIGDNRARRGGILRVREIGLDLVSAVHPGAYVGSRVATGAGVVVSAGAILALDVRLDDGAIVNTGSIVDHDGEIGACAHVGPGCTLAGHVRVGPEAFIGAGASIIDGVCVGEGATVGAGAVVLHDVPPGKTVGGVPAREL